MDQSRYSVLKSITEQGGRDFCLGSAYIHSIGEKQTLSRKHGNIPYARITLNKETETLNATIDQLGLIDIYRTFHPKTMNFTFFSTALEPSPG